MEYPLQPLVRKMVSGSQFSATGTQDGVRPVGNTSPVGSESGDSNEDGHYDNLERLVWVLVQRMVLDWYKSKCGNSNFENGE